MRTLFVVLAAAISSSLFGLQEHEQWWEETIGKDIPVEDFRQWVYETQAADRILFREHIKQMNYQSILDAACGPCVDYWGLLEDHLTIEYQGLDISSPFIAAALQNNIPIVQGSIEAIPFQDNSFDLAYGRHIFEHLSGYEKALNELIRVARREAMAIFFITPSDSPTQIRTERYLGDKPNPEGFLVYGNCYNATEIENFIKKNPKVSSFSWENVGEYSRCILHIYIR